MLPKVHQLDHHPGGPSHPSSVPVVPQTHTARPKPLILRDIEREERGGWGWKGRSETKEECPLSYDPFVLGKTRRH